MPGVLAMGQQLRAMGVQNLEISDFSNAVKAAFDGKEPELSP